MGAKDEADKKPKVPGRRKNLQDLDMADLIKYDDTKASEEQLNFEIESRRIPPLNSNQANELINQLHQRLKDSNHSFQEKRQYTTILKNADFWFHKGIRTAKNKDYTTAVECYK